MPSGGGGDYGRWHTFYQSKNVSFNSAAVTGADAIVPRNAFHQIWVQKISFFGDDVITATDGAGVVIGVLDPAVHETGVMDFGPQGVPLTIGEELDVTGGTAGMVHIEAYEKLAVATALLAV